MSDRGFLARRGVLELAMSIEACMLSWLEGGCLSTPSTPPVSAPGATPDNTGRADDDFPSKTTDCFLPWRYENSHLSVDSLIPQALSFSSRDRWGTESNALRRSKKMAQISLPWSIEWSHLCVTSSNAETVDQNPHCCRASGMADSMCFRICLYKCLSNTLLKRGCYAHGRGDNRGYLRGVPRARPLTRSLRERLQKKAQTTAAAITALKRTTMHFYLACAMPFGRATTKWFTT